MARLAEGVPRGAAADAAGCDPVVAVKVNPSGSRGAGCCSMLTMTLAHDTGRVIHCW